MSRVVLVVDDEELTRFSIAERLSEAGLEVLEAQDADAALQIFAERDDITDLITDVKMPGSMDGFALARIVSDRWGHVSLMVISGHTNPSDPRLPPSAGFMHKPFSSEALLRVLQSD